MNWPKLPKYNIALVTLFFILFFALLLSGQWVYQEFALVLPIKKQLTEVSKIKESSVTFEDGNLSVTVKLNEVENLQDSFHEIKNSLPKGNKYSLNIADQRDEYLDKIWRQCRFALEEAAILNNLVETKEEVRKNLNGFEVEKWILEIDGDNLYFQMHSSDSYLYEIIPRNNFLNSEKSS